MGTTLRIRFRSALLILPAIVMVALLAPLASADVFIWSGAVSDAWQDEDNWTSLSGGGGLPTSADQVAIAAAANQPNLGSSAACLDLAVLVGATLTITDGYLHVYGQLNVYGSLEKPGGQLEVDGLLVVAAGGSASLGEGGDGSSSPTQVWTGLVVEDGGELLTTASISIWGDSTIEGSMVVEANFLQSMGDWTNDGSVTFGPDGALFMGGPYEVGGTSLTSFNELFANGGAVTVTSPIEGVTIGAFNGSQLVLEAETTTQELNLQVDSRVDVNADVHVSSLVRMLEGSVLDANTGLDVAGDVLNEGGNFQTNSAVHTVRGDWDSSAAGAMTTGTGVIEFEGSGSVTVGTGSLPEVRCSVGTRTCTGPVEIVGNLVVAAGATLDVADQSLTARGTLVDVRGHLLVAGGGQLRLGSTSVATVRGAAARLRVVGELDQPALVDAFGGAGYSLTVTAGATLAARNFLFGGMGAGGLRITSTAVIAAEPDDLRSGTFERPFPASGSVLLHVQQPVGSPQDFHGVDFEDPLDAAASFDVRNVRTLAGAQMTFTNSAGDLAGEAFEDDGGTLIDWETDLIAVDGFTVRPGPEQVSLSWTGTNEPADLDAYRIDFATGSPPGAFAELTTLAPLGDGSSYVLEHTSLDAEVVHLYRLLAVFTGGATQTLATGQATPYASDMPRSFLTVGAGGAYADIQSAIDAATVENSVVSIASGSYAAFTIRASAPVGLHVLADGSGSVVIDTSLQPVEIVGLSYPGDSVELSGLEIGSATSPHDGLFVDTCAGVVVLDDLVVQGGSGKVGIRLDASVRTAIQRCEVAGAPGLKLTNDSLAVMSRGSLDDVEVSDTSFLRLCELVPGASTVASGATLTSYLGIMPDLVVDAFVPLHDPFQLVFKAAPGSLLQLTGSTQLEWVDPLKPKFQMVGLLPLPALVLVPLGAVPAGGLLALDMALPPDSALLGVPIVLQPVAKDTGTGVMRFGNVQTIVGVP